MPSRPHHRWPRRGEAGRKTDPRKKKRPVGASPLRRLPPARSDRLGHLATAAPMARSSGRPVRQAPAEVTQPPPSPRRQHRRCPENHQLVIHRAAGSSVLVEPAGAMSQPRSVWQTPIENPGPTWHRRRRLAIPTASSGRESVETDQGCPVGGEPTTEPTTTRLPSGAAMPRRRRRSCCRCGPTRHCSRRT